MPCDPVLRDLSTALDLGAALREEQNASGAVASIAVRERLQGSVAFAAAVARYEIAREARQAAWKGWQARGCPFPADIR